MLLLVATCVASATVTAAQVETQTMVQRGVPRQKVHVERAEVVCVAGNELVIKTDDSQIEHVVVADEVTVAVDDSELLLRSETGLGLQRTITRMVSASTVTGLKTVEGNKFFMSPSQIL